jgi:hypothetical protein
VVAACCHHRVIVRYLVLVGLALYGVGQGSAGAADDDDDAAVC